MVKTEFKLKKAKKTKKLLKDKATVNFLFEHMKPAKINFSLYLYNIEDLIIYIFLLFSFF